MISDLINILEMPEFLEKVLAKKVHGRIGSDTGPEKFRGDNKKCRVFWCGRHSDTG